MTVEGSVERVPSQLVRLLALNTVRVYKQQPISGDRIEWIVAMADAMELLQIGLDAAMKIKSLHKACEECHQSKQQLLLKIKEYEMTKSVTQGTAGAPVFGTSNTPSLPSSPNVRGVGSIAGAQGAGVGMPIVNEVKLPSGPSGVKEVGTHPSSIDKPIR